MKVLVTGASGFLGKFLVKALAQKGAEVTALNSKNCDLTSSSSLEKYSSASFAKIYHLAAWTQAGDFCLRHPGEQWLINQKINTHVLDWWQKAQPQAKMIAIGTSCSYDPELPLEEEFYLQGNPIDSLFTYAMTKRMLLSGLEALHKQYGLSYLYVVPSTLYGPNYHEDGRQMHFIFDLVRKILRGRIYNDPVVLWGDGTQIREIITVNDFVSALFTLEKKIENDLVNIGAGKGHTIREFAELICQKACFPMEKVEFDTSKYVGAKTKVLSTKKLQKILPEFSHTPLKQGIEELVDWFENQYFSPEKNRAEV